MGAVTAVALLFEFAAALLGIPDAACAGIMFGAWAGFGVAAGVAALAAGLLVGCMAVPGAAGVGMTVCMGPVASVLLDKTEALILAAGSDDDSSSPHPTMTSARTKQRKTEREAFLLHIIGFLACKGFRIIQHGRVVPQQVLS